MRAKIDRTWRHWKIWVGLALGWTGIAEAQPANWVRFEKLAYSYVVHLNYTIPELREFREARVHFKNLDQARKFFWRMVRGEEFHREKLPSGKITTDESGVAKIEEGPGRQPW